MMPTKLPYRTVRFVGNGIFQVSCVTDEWDKQERFNETEYFHYLNLGWCRDE